MNDKELDAILRDQDKFLRDAASAHVNECKAKRSVFVGANFASCSYCGWHVTAFVRDGKAILWTHNKPRL